MSKQNPFIQHSDRKGLVQQSRDLADAAKEYQAAVERLNARAQRNAHMKEEEQAMFFKELKRAGNLLLAHLVGALVGVAVFVLSPSFIIGASMGVGVVLTALFAPAAATVLFGSALISNVAALSGPGLALTMHNFAASFGILAALSQTIIKPLVAAFKPKPKTILGKLKAKGKEVLERAEEVIAVPVVFDPKNATPLAAAIFSGTVAADDVAEKLGQQTIYQDTPAGEVALDIAHLANGNLRGMFR